MDAGNPIRGNGEAAATGKPSDGQDHALTHEEKLEESLEDSMIASDPPAVTHPGDHGEPVPSSGFPGKDN
ncbi:MAG: hypothetical protein DI547_08830 [Sphingobium sp.]|nr:MAG: hypothetical protein DI547_08830 [Sphingobium sp.]